MQLTTEIAGVGLQDPNIMLLKLYYIKLTAEPKELPAVSSMTNGATDRQVGNLVS